MYQDLTTDLEETKEKNIIQESMNTSEDLDQGQFSELKTTSKVPSMEPGAHKSITKK